MEIERGRIAIDPVLFTIHQGALKVFLQERETGVYELPGGLLRTGETAEQALQRKLREHTGYDDVFFEQFFTFTAPDRDPRERTVSIGYIALINEQRIKSEANWFAVQKLPKLAFDHKDIVKQAQHYLQMNIDTLIVKQFLPARFPLNQLQRAYELITGMPHDNRNFRKKVLSGGIVEETKEVEMNVSHRPAKLFRFSAK